MDDPILLAEQRLCADGLGEGLLQSGEVVGMYPIPEYPERHRIYVRTDVEDAMAFARCSREQSSCVPPVAAHAPDLLALGHPHIGLAEGLEELRRFEGDGRL